MTADRFAVVTGAGSGIGRAASLALLAQGWTVVLFGRRIEPLHATRELAADPARADPVACDVTDPDAVEHAFASVRQRHGRLDLLFNNAGGNTPSTSFGDLTWGRLRRSAGRWRKWPRCHWRPTCNS